MLLIPSIAFYLWMNRRDTTRSVGREPMTFRGGFELVLGNRYLRLIALLVVLLNLVNTTGEYVLVHVGFALSGSAELEQWRDRLDELGIAHGGIKKAGYGSGLSFRDPDNIALEFFIAPGT